MLILTVKLEELIWVGDVEVKVIEVMRNRVRLGVTAPKSVRVDRDKVRQQRLRDRQFREAADRDEGGDA